MPCPFFPTATSSCAFFTSFCFYFCAFFFFGFGGKAGECTGGLTWFANFFFRTASNTWKGGALVVTSLFCFLNFLMAFDAKTVNGVLDIFCLAMCTAWL